MAVISRLFNFNELSFNPISLVYTESLECEIWYELFKPVFPTFLLQLKTKNPLRKLRFAKTLNLNRSL